MLERSKREGNPAKIRWISMFQSMFLRMLSTYPHVQTVIRCGKARRTRIRWQFFRTCENIFHYDRKTSKNTLYTTFSHRCLLIWLHIRDQREISRRVTCLPPLCEDFNFSTRETGWYRNPAENRFWNLSNCHDDLLPIGNSYTKYWKIDQKSHPRVHPFSQISCLMKEICRLRHIYYSLSTSSAWVKCVL